MRLLDKALGWLGYVKAQGPPWIQAGSPGVGPVISAWTQSRIEQVRHFQHWTYVGVSRICEKIAQLTPICSVLRDGEESVGNPERYLAPRDRQKALMPLQAHENLEPLPCDHPLPLLFQNANVFDTQFDLWYETVLYLSLTGNSYWWAPVNNAGFPTELWVLPSHWVWPIYAKQGGIEAYQLRPVEGSYTGMKIPAEDVIHFKKKSPVSKVDGYSAQSAGSRWIDAVESIDKSRSHSFINGMMPGLGVEFDPNAAPPTPEQLDRIEARMMNRYAGEHRTGRPLFVPPGAKIKPLTFNPKEMDFNGSFEQLRDSVLALFGVPAVVAGITKNMTYGSVMASLASFCTFTINPITSYLGQAITAHLAKRFDPKIRVWWPDCTPEDPEVREKEMKLDCEAGTISVNEQRRARGRKPWPGGTCPAGDKPVQIVRSRPKPGGGAGGQEENFGK